MDIGVVEKAVGIERDQKGVEDRENDEDRQGRNGDWTSGSF